MSDSSCKKCSEKNKYPFPLWTIVASLYITCSSVYGTIKLVEKLFSLF